jgi:hypothetical protein
MRSAGGVRWDFFAEPVQQNHRLAVYGENHPGDPGIDA